MTRGEGDELSPTRIDSTATPRVDAAVATIRRQLAECPRCAAHWLANEYELTRTAKQLVEDIGSTLEGWLRSYLSRFHDNAHRSVSAASA